MFASDKLDTDRISLLAKKRAKKKLKPVEVESEVRRHRWQAVGFRQDRFGRINFFNLLLLLCFGIGDNAVSSGSFRRDPGPA